MAPGRKSQFLPLIKGWGANTFSHAFLLNAIATSLAAASAASVHAYIAEKVKRARSGAAKRKQPSSLFERYVILPLASASETGDQREETETLLVFLVTFLVAIAVYNALYLLVGFGGGMIASGKPPPYD